MYLGYVPDPATLLEGIGPSEDGMEWQALYLQRVTDRLKGWKDFCAYHNYCLPTVLGERNSLSTLGQDMLLGIGTGNPGVFQGYPHLYPRKPIPMPRGMGFDRYGYGFCKNPGVCNLCMGTLPKLTEKPHNSTAGVN